MQNQAGLNYGLESKLFDFYPISPGRQVRDVVLARLIAPSLIVDRRACVDHGDRSPDDDGLIGIGNSAGERSMRGLRMHERNATAQSKYELSYPGRAHENPVPKSTAQGSKKWKSETYHKHDQRNDGKTAVLLCNRYVNNGHSVPSAAKFLWTSLLKDFVLESVFKSRVWCELGSVHRGKGCSLACGLVGTRIAGTVASRMGPPLNGRALTFPVLWGRAMEAPVAGPQPAEVPSPSDEELMARITAKDTEALDLLYTRYSRLVFAIAVRTLRDKSEAEEVVQEVFLSLYQKAAQFDPNKGSAKAWVVQIAFSRSRDRKGHLLRRGFYSGTDIDALDDTLAGETDIEREVGLRFDVSRLVSAFEALTQMQRITLELFYFQGLELREISERLHEPIGNVRHHFYRGLERLRNSPAVKRLRETRDE